jgi:hypothetical protein
MFPSLRQLRRNGIAGTPIAFASAQSAAVFIEHFPSHLAGVYPPEALSAKVRQTILSGMSRRGFRIQRETIEHGATAQVIGEATCINK